MPSVALSKGITALLVNGQQGSYKQTPGILSSKSI